MLELGSFLVLLLLGLTFGKLAEARHYRRIREREEEFRDLLVMPGRVLPRQYVRHDSTLVTGSVVISTDYFKRVLAGLRGLVGGRISAYESLLDRARREAILRMQAQARDLGAEAVFNLKLETSRISGGAKSRIGSVEVLAYGTALFPRP